MYIDKKHVHNKTYQFFSNFFFIFTKTTLKNKKYLHSSYRKNLQNSFTSSRSTYIYVLSLAANFIITWQGSTTHHSFKVQH